MMKKILFAILMILIISTISGCGSNDTKNADKNKPNVSQSTNNSEEKIKVTKIASNYESKGRRFESCRGHH